MKRRIFATILCCALIICGCSSKSDKYLRISFKNQSLDDRLGAITANTSVVNNTSETFASQMPVYEVKERIISTTECDEMVEKLGLPSVLDDFDHEGNSIYIRLSDDARNYYDMTEEEVEKAAREVFDKIPFLEGEYEYFGIRGEQRIWDSDGKHIVSVLVSFFPLLDGVRVIGDNRCDMWFDGDGLVELYIKTYDYKKVDTMDMVPLADAEAKIKTPDDLNFEEDVGAVDVLKVERVKLLLINQHCRGCTILQPAYNFIGTAIAENGTQTEFKSKVIAIPEEMTYEEE